MNVINNIVISDYDKKDKLIKLIDSNKDKYPFANIARIKKLFTKNVFGETVFTDSHYDKIMEDLDKPYKSHHYIWHIFPPETIGLSDGHKIQFTEEDIKLFLTMDRCMYTDEEYDILIKWLEIHKKIYEKFKPASFLIKMTKKQQGEKILQYFGSDDYKAMTFYMFWFDIVSNIEFDKMSNILDDFKFDDDGNNFFDYINYMRDIMIKNKDKKLWYNYTIRDKITNFRNTNKLTSINWEPV